MELEGYELVMRATELSLQIRSEVNTHPLISKYFHIAHPGGDGSRRVPRLRASRTTGRPTPTGRRSIDAWDNDEFALDPTRLTLVCGTAGFDGTAFKGLLAAKYDIQLNKTSRNSVLVQTNINNTRSDVAQLIKVLADISREIEKNLAQGGKEAKAAFAARVKSLMTDVPDLPNFSRFHDAFRENPKSATSEGHMRPAFFVAYDAADCDHVKLGSKEIDERLKKGPELVSANLVIPYPPGFPIMVPGQVITKETIDFMRKLDVKEIHGYHAAEGLKLIKPSVLAARKKKRAKSKYVFTGPSSLPANGRRQGQCEPGTKGRFNMEAFFKYLAANPFLLLFLTVGLAVWVGKFSVKGYGLGMVAAAIVVGVALATWASTYGVKLQLDNFAKSLMYYLFMYGVGLRVGPSFFNSLKKDGLTFTILAVVCAFLGLGLVVVFSRWFDLPAGAVGGVLAGSQTMSAAIGTAEMAVTQGAYKMPDGLHRRGGVGDDRPRLRHHLHLGHRRHHPDLQVPAQVVGGRCQDRPRRSTRRSSGCRTSTTSGSAATGRAGSAPTVWRTSRPPARRIAQFRQTYPQYRIVNIVRGGEALGASPDLVMQAGDVVALGGRLEDLTANMGLLGPEVPDAKALAIPLDQAEILVTEKGVVGKALKEFRHEEFAGQLQVVRMERGGVPFPVGAETELQRFDVIFVAGLKSAVEKVARCWGGSPGRARRPTC